MGLMAQAQQDIYDILNDSDAGFAVPVTLTTPSTVSPTISVTVNALAIKHNLSFTDMGEPKTSNTKTARVTVSEQSLTDAGFPVRNGDDKVILKGVIVSFVDAANTTYTSVIREVNPGDMTGHFVCSLGDKN